MSDKAETWFQNGDSHDLADPVQVWEKTHTSQVVNGHNDSSKGIIWMAHDLKERLVGDDTGEDALIVAEEHERELAREHDRYTERSATAEDGVLCLHLESGMRGL